MIPNEAYDALLAHLKETAALEQVMGLLSWDQETVMPPAGAPARAEQAAALTGVLHARRTDPRIPEWVALCGNAELGQPAAVNCAEAARDHARASRVPSALAKALARAEALGQAAWAEARPKNDFKGFTPILEELVALKREQAQCLATDDLTPYDALLDQFEPGARASDLAGIFETLRAGLVALREKIDGAASDIPELRGTFPEHQQLDLARTAATRLGYDWEAGRLDLVAHPFCSGAGRDVRITTRVDINAPLDCLYSTIHETGHAIYEQGIDSAHAMTPAGSHASMGIHESQSRLLENQIARGPAFARWLFAEAKARFGDIGVTDADSFYAAVNRVEPGLIRTEADEVHYNLHIMMRFDLERALISGDLAVDDLETAWNTRFAADFGRTVPNSGDGVLQDVHWSCGLFGYFPTYTLGNLYAAQLYATMRRDLPALDDDMIQGEASAAVSWLRDRVHRHGRLYAPAALIEHATGAQPTPAPLLEYLDAKFSALYAL